MKFNEVIEALKTTYSRRILESYGYDNTRKKYTALESGEHNNGDRTPSMGLYNKGGSFYLKDFAGKQKMYSSIDTIMLKEGLSFADAVKYGAEICGIEIDSERQQEELSPDMKYIISGLYRKAKQENFSIKSITGKYHYPYRDVTGKKLFDKYRIDYVDAEGEKHKHIVQGKENNGFIKFKFENGEYQNLIAMYGDFRQFEPGEKVYIPEGEKCVDVSKENGVKNVATVGSSNDFRYKGKKFAPFFKGTDIVILQDNDKPGEKLTREIISALREVANSIKVIVPDKSREKADIADFFQNGGTLQQLEEMERKTVPVQKASGELIPSKSMQTTAITPKDAVLSLLAYKENSKGENKIIQSVRNFEIVLENDVRFIGRIRFNEFSQQTYLIGNTAWENRNNHRPWSSFDDSAAFSILQSDYGLNSRNDYFDAVRNVSVRNRFHPVRELLDSLKWDKREHIRNFLTDYIGVEDSEYSYQVFKLWLLGGVSRIFQPGIKFDYVIVLKGPQGIGKSTILTLLAINEEWFNDSLDSLDSDKSAQSLMGSWIIELAELKSLARTAGGVDSVKRFLSATQDKYRIPYERRADIFQRQCVFAGTTNRDDFLQDETGNRRFLILEAGVNEPKKDLFSDDVMEEVKQVWAQAVHIYKNEHPKLILPDFVKKKAEEMQADSMADDGKVGLITEYLSNKSRVCAIEVWQKALNEQGRPQKWQASEINSIILGLPGWKKMSSPAKFGEYGSQRGFQKVCSKNAKDCSSTTRDCSNEFMQITDEMLSELPFD